ncbi:MAG: ABC transporter permease [Candidatus Dormibacteria bacterium]
MRPLTLLLPSGRRAPRLIERSLMVVRHSWLVVFSGFFEPVFYLLGIGYGVGSLVGTVNTDGGALSYAQFVAPALMAASAMNGGIFESTFNLFHKLKYARLYDVVLATPLGVGDVALGEIGYAVLRGTLYGAGFLLVMVVLHVVESPWAVLAAPAAVLIVFAFASAGTAATTYVRAWGDFDLIQLVLVPLFLFSATFYPLSAYPSGLQVVVELTPLYHGVHLVRALCTGAVSAGCLLDVVYLVGMGLVGLAIAERRLAKLLLR